MNFYFLEACFCEGQFCAKHYNPIAYWRDRIIDPHWYDCYQMGSEL